MTTKAYGATPAERARLLIDRTRADKHRFGPRVKPAPKPAFPATCIDGTVAVLDAGGRVPVEALAVAVEFVGRFGADGHPAYGKTARGRKEWARRRDVILSAYAGAFGAEAA